MRLRTWMLPAALAMGMTACPKPGPTPVPPPGETYADQGWTPEDREVWYRLSQGSLLLPYDWYVALEDAESEAFFNRAAVYQKWRYLPGVDDATDPKAVFPPGWSTEITDIGDGKIPYVGLTCGACHTGRVRYGDLNLVIDGAGTMGDLEGFLRYLVEAMEATKDDRDKWARFQARVLPNGTPDEVAELQADFDDWLERRQGFSARTNSNGGESSSDWSGSYGGFSRLDALGGILNQLFEHALELPENRGPMNAPVSYPFTWDTPYYSWVEWNASATNVGLGPLGRNVGEALGTFSMLDVTVTKVGQESPDAAREFDDPTAEELAGWYGPAGVPERTEPTPADDSAAQDADEPENTEFDDALEGGGADEERCPQPPKADRGNSHYTSTVQLGALGKLESTLRKLKAPKWPEQFPAIDLDKAQRGANLYTAHCAGCHPVRDRDTIPEQAKLEEQNLLSTFGVTLDKLGTDPNYVRNVLDRTPKTGRLYGTKVTIFDSKRFNHEASGGDCEPNTIDLFKSMVMGATAEHPMIDVAQLAEAIFEGRGVNMQTGPKLVLMPEAQPNDEGRLDLYKSRSLTGIWATAPYLHNGAVPTLDDLLKPEDQRPAVFWTGTFDYDPVKVGYVTAEAEGLFKLDTSISGNSNKGHAYPATPLTDAERADLLEYLKTL